MLETFKESITFRNHRYEVRLPWKEDHDLLPDNYTLSLCRLQSLLRRLRLKPEQLKEYDHVIKDQLARGIIERVDSSASAREDGPALNDCLHTGPPLTPDILDILIGFCLHPVAVVADIEKAFLMISVEENE